MGLLPSRIHWPHLHSRIRSLSGKSAYVMGGQLLGMALGFGAAFLLSHWVAKEDYARYALFISLASLGIVSHGGLINFSTRYWSVERENHASLWRFITSTFWRQTPLLLALVLAATLFASTPLTLLNWCAPFVFAGLSTVGSTWLTLNTAALNAGEQYRRLFLMNALSAVLRFAGPIGLAFVFHGSFPALAGGYTIYILVSCAIAAARFQPAPPETEKKPANPMWPEQLISYGRPFVWIGIGGWLLQFADRWIVSFFFDTGRLADFSYASQLVSFLPSITATWLLQIAYPGIFRHVDTHGANTDWRLLLRRTDILLLVFFALTAIGTVLLIGLASLLIGNVISEAYRNSLSIMFPAAMTATSLQANQFHYLLLQASLNSQSNMRIILWVSFIKTLATVAAAAVSWQALMIMWIASPILGAILNRFLVRRVIFQKSPAV